VEEKQMTTLPKRKANRLSNYDYSDAGWYFITICSYNRQNIFGEYNSNIVGGDGGRPAIDTMPDPKITLTKFGLIVDEELKKSEIIRNEIKIDEYVIMPNHVHAIVIIENENDGFPITGRPPSTPTIGHYKKSLSSFVAGFKSTVTRRVNLLRGTPQQTVWQRSFYDHIIRNEKSLDDIPT
jgi:putative transposase